MAGNQERQFRFGAIVHEDYQELAMLLPELEDRLNQNINLKDYTDRVERIYFAPILMPEGVDGEEEERWFDENKGALFLKIKMKENNLKINEPSDFSHLLGGMFSDNLLEIIPETLHQKIQQVIYKTD